MGSRWEEQVQNNGATRGGPGAGAAHGGGEVVIVHPALMSPEAGGEFLWAPGPPWLMLRGRQDAWAQAHSQAPPLGPRNPARLP
jgi:hypothetical protein